MFGRVICCEHVLWGVSLSHKTIIVDTLLAVRPSVRPSVSSHHPHFLSPPPLRSFLRVLAHFSGDEGLVSTLLDLDKDPFRMLAARWRGIEPEQVGGG